MKCVKCDFCGTVSGEVRYDIGWQLQNESYIQIRTSCAKEQFHADDYCKLGENHLCPDCIKLAKAYLNRWFCK